MTPIAQKVFRRELTQTHRHCRMDCFPFLQRLDELEHFAPVLQLLLCAQGDLLRVNPPCTLRLHFGERGQRAVRVAAVGTHVGGRHQARVLPVGLVDLGEPFVAPRIFMHAMRRGGRDQTSGALVVAIRERILRGFFSARKAPGVQIADRVAQCGVRLRDPRASAIGRHALRHAPDIAHDAQQRVHQDEQHHQSDHEQIQRDVDAVRRIDQQHLPHVEASDHRQHYGDGEQQREP